MKLTPQNIDDVILAGHQKGLKHFKWTPDEWKTLAEFALLNGYNLRLHFLGDLHTIKQDYE